MKKLLNILLLLTSLIGYLEWGHDGSEFLFQTEYSLLFGNAGTKDSFMHPMVMVPLLGQILLLITVFQKTPGKVLTYIGMSCIGILLLFLFIIGAMAMNLKIALCALPFIVVSILVIRAHRKHRTT